MNFLEYQAAALRTAPEQPPLAGLVHASLGLATETGEFTSEVKRMSQYGKGFTPEMHAHMAEELGDVLWYVALACEHLGVSMRRVAEQNIAKLQLRFPEKFDAAAAEARADKGGVGHRES